MKSVIKEYDAFISYRHCELDSFVAKAVAYISSLLVCQ